MAKLIANYRRDYPLTYHTFFLRMESWLNYDVKHLKVDNDDFRTLVFQDFLTIKFTECIRFMKDLAGKEDVWDDFHPNELKDMTINIIMQCINSYEEKAKLEGIPDIVVEKFNDWHSPRVKFTLDGIKAVCGSQFYRNNKSRIAACLDLLTVAFHDTLLDAERTLKHVNGELDGKVYKGVKCNPKPKSSHG